MQGTPRCADGKNRVTAVLAVLGTVAVKGTVLGLVGTVIIIAFGPWLKALLEKRWLRRELAPAYYRRRQSFRKRPDSWSVTAVPAPKARPGLGPNCAEGKRSPAIS